MPDSNTKEIYSLNEIIDLIKSEEFDKQNCHLLKSVTPENCLQNECILGVDEAGRGPVLGPMVYSVFYCSAHQIEVLEEIGCTDSKSLTEKKRENIFELILNNSDKVGWMVDIISPNKISNLMNKRVRYSLNEIAQNSTIALIEAVLGNKIKVTEIYVDTIGPPEKYRDKLSKLFPNLKVTVEKKADSLYPVVGAASICAKVIRDTIVQNWKFAEYITPSNNDRGTGYPGDPKTKKFLIDNLDEIFGFPNLIRFSWSTTTNLLKKVSHVDWINETQNNSGSSSLTEYVKSIEQEQNSNSNSTCRFFKRRALSNIDNF